MSKLLDNILANTSIKPYILQRQEFANHWSSVWETLYDKQFDTLEEAQAALERIQGAGKYCYRIAQASPRIEYVPVKGARV